MQPVELAVSGLRPGGVLLFGTKLKRYDKLVRVSDVIGNELEGSADLMVAQANLSVMSLIAASRRMSFEIISKGMSQDGVPMYIACCKKGDGFLFGEPECCDDGGASLPLLEVTYEGRILRTIKDAGKKIIGEIDIPVDDKFREILNVARQHGMEVADEENPR